MTKPSASLPVLYARVPVETYALAQLLAGNGKTSLSKWIADIIESQRGTLGGQPLPSYAQPAAAASCEFAFAFDSDVDAETRQRAVRLADWILRAPNLRNKQLWTGLNEASHHAYVGARPMNCFVQTMRAFEAMRGIVVISPDGAKAHVFDVYMSDDPMLDHRVGVRIGQKAAEIWDENHHAWWEMVRTLPRLIEPEYWDNLRAYETSRKSSVNAAAVAAEHEPGYAVAAVAPVKRGRGRPRKVQQLDREDGHQRAAETACSSGDE